MAVQTKMSILSNIYSQSKIDSNIGKNSTSSEINQHITHLWESWELSELQINLSKLQHKQIIKHLTEMGYDLGFDFQFRGNGIRFYDSIIQGMFTLTFSDCLVSIHGPNGFKAIA